MRVHTHTHTHTHTHSHAHAHTHTRTHTLSLSFSLPGRCCQCKCRPGNTLLSAGGGELKPTKFSRDLVKVMPGGVMVLQIGGRCDWVHQVMDAHLFP